MLGSERFGPFGRHAPKAFGHTGLTEIAMWADPDRKIAAAVVMPRTNWFSPWSTTPTPMNPMPVIAPATACGASRHSTAVMPAIDAPIKPNVRSPAGEPRSSRSNPTVNASAKPTATRARSSQSDGTGPPHHTAPARRWMVVAP